MIFSFQFYSDIVDIQHCFKFKVFNVMIDLHTS